MQSLAYSDVKRLSRDAIDALACSCENFVVVSDRRTGMHVRRFLENESRFRSGRKTLKSRIAYVYGAWPGFLLLHFVPLWVSSTTRGYQVTVAESRPMSFEIRFEYEGPARFHIRV